MVSETLLMVPELVGVHARRRSDHLRGSSQGYGRQSPSRVKGYVARKHEERRRERERRAEGKGGNLETPREQGREAAGEKGKERRSGERQPMRPRRYRDV